LPTLAGAVLAGDRLDGRGGGYGAGVSAVVAAR
jgi:hypothetical protein